MKVGSDVIRSVRTHVDFDDAKCEDDDYLAEKQSEILEKAAKEFNCSAKELLIHDSDVVGLVE